MNTQKKIKKLIKIDKNLINLNPTVRDTNRDIA